MRKTKERRFIFKKFKKKIGASLAGLMVLSAGAVFAGENAPSIQPMNDVYINYTTISPKGGAFGDLSKEGDLKKWDGDGSVKVNSTTEGRRSAYRMKSNQSTGGETVNLYQGEGSKLPVGAIRNGQKVQLQSKTPVWDSGIYGTTCRGNWKSN